MAYASPDPPESPIGRKLKVGATFETKTKWMSKRRYGPQFKVRRPGDLDFFVHENRRYWCEVICTVETRVRKHGKYPSYTGVKHIMGWMPREFLFIYLVKILAN